MMIKSLSLTLLSLVALLSHSPLFAFAQQENTADALAGRGLRHGSKGSKGSKGSSRGGGHGGGRGGGHGGGGHRGGRGGGPLARHHNQGLEDGHEHALEEAYVVSHPDHEYLPEDVTPYPFQNCVPESFRVARGHQGKMHHHHKGPKHHHHEGGAGHNHPGKHHQMMKHNKQGGGGRGHGYVADDDAYYYGASKGKGGKGGSKGSKGSYYRQRKLFRREGNHGGRARPRNGGGTGRGGGNGGGGGGGNGEGNRNGNPAVRQQPQPQDDDGADDGVHVHGPGELSPLPLCPRVPPVRETFNSVPTLPLSFDITAPGASPGDVTGGAPVDIPPGTDRVFVESFLEFGFFPEVTVRTPTQAEIDGLLVETSRFYTEVLRATYPNLDSFQATLVTSSTDLAATGPNDDPVMIDFDANAFFTTGTTVPSAAEVFAVLERADYQDYIMNYVWMAAPMGGLFADVQRAGYNARTNV